jgi:hypothetical protein
VGLGFAACVRAYIGVHGIFIGGGGVWDAGENNECYDIRMKIGRGVEHVRRFQGIHRGGIQIR